MTAEEFHKIRSFVEFTYSALLDKAVTSPEYWEGIRDFREGVLLKLREAQKNEQG